ncbi:MAG TPA: voltage-gated chloride channel [Deltaproteobacteria bacterium]|nr:voltage-gated chloride channel [Deltaproteobacteria bacterium]
MRERIEEESVLFVSVIKWLVLATITGAIVGAATTVFLKALEWGVELGGRHEYTFLLLPVAFFLSAYIIEKLAPEAEGHGTEKVIEAVHHRSGKIDAPVVPVKLVATVVTIAAGGSAGKEGPCAQIGAGLSSLFADLFKFNDVDRKKLVICGISAGFSTVFGTPIAGAIFGIEVLFIGTLLYDVLLPSFIAGIVGFQVSSALGVHYFYNLMDSIPGLDSFFLAKVLLSGLFFGLCSFLHVELLNLGKSISSRLPLSKPVKGLVGGAAVAALVFVFSRDYLGLGVHTIEAVLLGEPVPWYSSFAKGLFTSITLNFGGSGGIVTPTFFVGATSGSFFADIMGFDRATFAAIGLAALVAGAANTPIAASIMAVELFGSKLAPYAATACVVSFFICGHRSVYPSQILALKKSASLQVELGREIERIRPAYQQRSRSVTGVIGKAATLVRDRLKRRAAIERGAAERKPPAKKGRPRQ